MLNAAAEQAGIPAGAIQLVEDTSRETANEMMRLNGYLDVLIPRGGAGLINSVVQNSTVPVIQTGVGNCHVYVDESADFEKAAKIVINAKTQRPGVCNACESLLVHEKIAEAFREKGKIFEIMNQMYFWHGNVAFADFHREYMRILGIFKAAGVKFSIGSDTHSCCGIGCFRWSERAAKELGVENELFIPSAFC